MSVVEEKAEAVDVLARQVLSLERWIDRKLAEEAGRPPLENLLAVLRQIMNQDLEPDPSGGGTRIIEGVAKDRRISVEDPDMRHGRKSKSKRIDGYKRQHIATDLGSQAILACSVTPANRPEHEALPELKADIDNQGIRFAEAHFDRGYMGSPAVAEIAATGAEILCKPWMQRSDTVFTKDQFDMDLRARTITCPAGHPNRSASARQPNLIRPHATRVGCVALARPPETAAGELSRSHQMNGGRKDYARPRRQNPGGAIP